MKNFKIILLVYCSLFFSTIAFAQTITVTTPSYGNEWCKGKKYIIRWTTNGSMNARVKIRLYRGPEERILGIINNTENDGEYHWTVSSFVEAGLYNIRVKTIDNLVYDDGNPFKIKYCVQPITIQMQSPKKPPQLSSLKINNGTETTKKSMVSLNHRFSRMPGIAGKATHYRARNMLTTSQWSRWKTYENEPRWNLLSNICGLQKVFFQLKNQFGESNVVADSISYAGREKIFKIPIGDAMKFAEQNGFSHTARKLDNNCGLCYIEYVNTGDKKQVLLLVQQKLYALGAKGEFVIFKGRKLKPGWKFVSYGYNSAWSDAYSQYFADYRLVSQPSADSLDITLKVRVWRGGFPNPVRTIADGLKHIIKPNASKIDLFKANWLQLDTITLKGPCNRDWKDAFLR